MAHEPAHPAEPADHTGHPRTPPPVEGPPVTPGKVAMWLFLATEVMFFTGLIGSYVVLRAGSPVSMFSNIAPPTTGMADLEGKVGLRILSAGPEEERVVKLLSPLFMPYAGTLTKEVDPEPRKEAVEEYVAGLLEGGHAVTPPLKLDEAKKLASELKTAGAELPIVEDGPEKGEVELEELKTYNWPQPYDTHTNPLSIDLTAVNTFILICSSVTMVLALSAIQKGNRMLLILYLLATVLIGATFLGIQVYEYRALMFEHHYPLGISRTGHFTPDVSLFASCFFVMTGFHGAHVAGGVILLTCILIGAILGKFTYQRHSPVELAGLYWHFVDLVWIILFTVVYLI